MRRLTLIATALALSACAGRTPEPTTVAFETDQIQECTTLENEVRSNASIAQAKIASNKSQDGGDIAVSVVSVIFFLPGLFLLDTKNADGVEGNALLDRNERLKQIALSKGCDVSHYPIVGRYE
jgi:hypothetical protein